MFELLMGKKKSSTAKNFAYFAASAQSNSVVAYGEKINYANFAVSPGKSLTSPRNASGYAGNYSIGIIKSGVEPYASNYRTINKTDIYTYSLDTVTAGAALGQSKENMGSAGNSSVGLFAGGTDQGSFRYNYMEKYNFATFTLLTGLNLTTPRSHLAGVGNETIALFSGGYDYDKFPSFYKTTQKYVHATNTATNSTSLGLGRMGVAGAGTVDFAIFLGGHAVNNNKTHYMVDKYTYSNNTVVSQTMMYEANGYCSATGNSEFGIFVSDKTTSNFNYAANTIATGNSLTKVAGISCALSSTPGNF